jgi:hypothetical protein
VVGSCCSSLVSGWCRPVYPPFGCFADWKLNESLWTVPGREGCSIPARSRRPYGKLTPPQRMCACRNCRRLDDGNANFSCLELSFRRTEGVFQSWHGPCNWPVRSIRRTVLEIHRDHLSLMIATPVERETHLLVLSVWSTQRTGKAQESDCRPRLTGSRDERIFR